MLQCRLQFLNKFDKIKTKKKKKQKERTRQPKAITLVSNTFNNFDFSDLFFQEILDLSDIDISILELFKKKVYREFFNLFLKVPNTNSGTLQVSQGN